MIVDIAKEMKLGEFAWKYKNVSCYLQRTEPYSPWPYSAKHEIRGLNESAAKTGLVRVTLLAALLCSEVQILCSIPHVT